MAETASPDPLDAARARLDRALAQLEQKARAVNSAPPADDDLFSPRPDESRRVAELEAAAREASAALGRAADEVRAALDGEG